MKAIILFVFLVSTFAFAGEQNVLLTGSSTVAPIMLDIAQAFEQSHPKTSIEVQTGGSTRGIIDLRRGLSQMGMISRDLKKSESHLKHKTIAIDGLGVIVHSNNPVADLNQQQLQQIYQRKITSWAQLGWHDKPIVVVHKAEGRSTLELFLKYLKIKNSSIKPHIIIGDNEQGIKTISGNPYAIGYVSIGAANYNIKAGSALKLLKLQGIEATAKNIKNKTYPILRSLNLIYTPKSLDPASEKLLSFSTSPKVKSILEKHYVIKPQ